MSADYHYTIRDLPPTDRPRERLRDHGPSALSNAELLGIVLRVGAKAENAVAMGQRLLAAFGGLGGLMRASFAELCQQHGLGEAKAAQIKAALELGRRVAASQPDVRPVVRSPADLAVLLQGEMGYLEQEHLRVVLLDTRNQVLGISEVYKGSVNSAQIRSGEVFREAVRRGCAAIAVVHNHPSGDPTPSDDDVAVTRQLIAAGKLLDIEVVDHIVIGHQRWASLRERGLAFEG